MTPIKGQFVTFVGIRGVWAHAIGCVLSVGLKSSRVSIMPTKGDSTVCTVTVHNDNIEDYQP